MTDTLIVLVLLAAGAAPDPIGAALTVAARQALGPNAEILIEHRPELPPVAEAQTLGERLHAGAVAEVEWVDAAHTTAVVRVHGEHETAWRERTIPFRPGDPPDECGRTLGFALASLVERTGEAPSLEPPPAPPGPVVPSTTVPVTAPPGAPRSPPMTFEAMGLATVGGGAGSTSGGGEGAGAVEVLGPLALVATAGGRAGEIAAASSTFVAVEVGGGAAWRVLDRPLFQLDARGELLALDLVVRRAGSTESAWLPEGRLLLEAGWFPGRSPIGLATMAGAEASFGSAFLVVGNHPVATVLPFRALVGLGARARF